MKLFPPFLAASAAFALAASAFGQNATTTPVGAVTVTIPAGTGAAKKTSLISLPLLQTAQLTGHSTGTISALTANSVSDATAGWASGELSASSTPKLLLITSGLAKGYMFLLSTTVPNTADTVTLSASDQAAINLQNLGISVGPSGDTYRILECDTLSSLLGTPASTGIQGGTTSAQSDTVILVVNGIASTYFYKTDAVPARWTKVTFGNPDASNTPVAPYYGIQYGRLPASQVTLSVTGDVPVEPRTVLIKNSGTTFLSQYFPTDTTLVNTGISSISGWLSGANATVADTVTLTSNGIASKYWFDGTNWRKSTFGNPVSDSTVIAAGTTLYIVKKGIATGYTPLTQELPYALN